MRYLKTFATCLVALALHSTAWAQVYETTDAEGNPEFTDAPPTENAEVIDLQQTNVADAPQSEPQDEAQPDTVETEQAPQQENTTVNVNVNDGNDDYDDGAYDDDLARQRAIERRDGAAPGEVGDPGYEMPREVGDSAAQMPREVGDSESQMPHEVGDAPDVTGAHRR
jgi:hypothetical protein